MLIGQLNQIMILVLKIFQTIFQGSNVIYVFGKNFVLSICFNYSGIFFVLFILILFKLGHACPNIALAPYYPKGFVLKCKKSTEGQGLSTR